MRQLIILIASFVVICVAYSLSFGLPEVVKQLFNTEVVESQDKTPKQGERLTRGSQETTIVTETLTAEEYTLTLRGIGTATSLRSVDVVSTVSGEITQVSMTANSKVTAGDVLLQLENRAEQRNLEIAMIAEQQAQATFNRYQELHNTGNNTITNVTLTDAEVALRLAKINTVDAQDALDERTLTAPIDGVIGINDFNVGDYLNSGDSIATIDDASIIVAQFEVPERSIALLEAGKSVLIGTPTYAGRVFEGTITAFDTTLDPTSRSATVQAQIDNVDGSLIAGMTLAVRIIEDTAPLPVVPATAITWDRTGAKIWVVEDGVAAQHPVAIRYRDGTRVWVETDVPLGASVVAEGAAKLRSGARVTQAAGV